MAKPHLKIYNGKWLVLSEKKPGNGYFVCDIDGEGESPIEAWKDYTSYFERLVDEALRIGKKVLPVILALVAGFLIGVLYGAG